MLKRETHNNTKKFLDLMHSQRIYLLIDKPTRVTYISATLIYSVLTNEL